MSAIDPDGVAARYFTGMRARDLAGVLALFAPEAVLWVPDGRRFDGVEAIGGWFTHLFGVVGPTPHAVSEVSSSRAIAVEIETQLPDGTTRRTANFFDLDERGLISGLRSYARG